MDKKIRAAAENYTPGYDDKAWQGMETLLEKHLPQKKKRRRIIFFIFFAGLLITGIPAYFIIKKTSSGNNTIVEHSSQKNDRPASPDRQQQTAPALPATPDAATANPPFGEQAPGNSTTATETEADQKIATTTAKPASEKASAAIKVKSAGIGGTRKSTASDQQQAIQNTIVSNAPVSNKNDNPVSTDKVPASQTQTPSATDVAKNDPLTSSGSISPKQEPVKQQTTDTTIATTTAAIEKPVKKDTSKGSGFFSKFFISLSAGPDLSSVGTKPGQWRGQYGAGIGYAISDKWSVRTGFYVARKIYSADSSSYKTPFTNVPGPYGPLSLNEIKANCLVYEIPVSVVYSFAKNNKHNWFVSGSVSSYIMKTERYACTYNDSWGQWQTHTYDFKNENSHLFSVIGISGGYQYHFNKRLSLMAEPYLKVPLGGVGQGKVKLNSVGALFTVGYKPFAKK